MKRPLYLWWHVARGVSWTLALVYAVLAYLSWWEYHHRPPDEEQFVTGLSEAFARMQTGIAAVYLLLALFLLWRSRWSIAAVCVLWLAPMLALFLWIPSTLILLVTPLGVLYILGAFAIAWPLVVHERGEARRLAEPEPGEPSECQTGSVDSPAPYSNSGS